MTVTLRTAVVRPTATPSPAPPRGRRHRPSSRRTAGRSAAEPREAVEHLNLTEGLLDCRALSMLCSQGSCQNKA